MNALPFVIGAYVIFLLGLLLDVLLPWMRHRRVRAGWQARARRENARNPAGGVK